MCEYTRTHDRFCGCQFCVMAYATYFERIRELEQLDRMALDAILSRAGTDQEYTEALMDGLIEPYQPQEDM